MLITNKERLGEVDLLTDPEGWLRLPDFLNISQVFQEGGGLIAVLYLLGITVAIFIIGVIFNGFLNLVIKVTKMIFRRDYNNLQEGFRE